MKQDKWAHFLWKVRCGCFFSSQSWVMFLICRSLWSFALVVVAHDRWLNKAVAVWRYIPLPRTTFLLFSDDVTFRRVSTTADVLRRWGVESFWLAFGPDALAHGSRMFSAEPQKRDAVLNGLIFRARDPSVDQVVEDGWIIFQDSPVWVNVVYPDGGCTWTRTSSPSWYIYFLWFFWLYKTFSPQRVNLINPKTVDRARVMKELQERCLPLYFMDESHSQGVFH